MDSEFYEAMHRVLDQVDAYALPAQQRGYTPAAVEMLAGQYHWLLMQQINREHARVA